MRYRARWIGGGARLALGWLLAWAAVLGAAVARAEAEGQRWAVLVGVNQYTELGNLTYCVADAKALRDRLIASGYHPKNVFLLVDGAESAYLPFRTNIVRRLETVLASAEKEDVVLVAFSGHGVHIGGKSYFCPTDASLRSPETTMVPLDFVYRQLEASPARQKLLLVDACRNDPRPPGERNAVAHQKSLDGLAKQLQSVPAGVLALSSSAAGQVSWEDQDLGHGVFMNYVLEGLSGKADEEGNRDGEVSILELFRYANIHTRRWVLHNREGRVQTPELWGKIPDDWVLARLPARAEPIKPPPPVAVAPFSAQQARRHQDAWAEHLGKPREFENSVGMKLVLIPPGEFMMGSPESEEDRNSDEGPQHRVRITRPFYFGTYQVTQEEYERVMGTNPSSFSRGGGGNDRVSGMDTSRFPVETVSWNDAAEFCRKLSALPAERAAGREYRLPTEAEWEYACRAGTTTPFHFGSVLNGRQANVDGNRPYGTSEKGPYLQRTTTVGSYSANGFGLFDMHGNVWEWCADWFSSDYYANSPVDDPFTQRGHSFGPRTIMLIAGKSWDMSPQDMNITTLTLEDAEVIRQSVDGLEIVSPHAWTCGIDLRHDSNQSRSNIWGVEPDWHVVWQRYVSEGEGITAKDVSTMARVCVIGSAVKRELFGGENPIGKELYANKVRLTVKGVLDCRGMAGPDCNDFDNRVMVPITTAMRRVMNVDHVSAISIVTRDTRLIASQTEAIRSLLRQRHRLPSSREDDFRLIVPFAETVHDGSNALPKPALASDGVCRGGSWPVNASLCRSGYRYGAPTDLRRNDLGFRVALVPAHNGDSGDAQQGVQWSPTLESAKHLARRSNRLVFMQFYAAWSPVCRLMGQRVFSRPDVAAAMEPNYVAVGIDTDRAAPIAKEFGVTALPAIVIVTPEGKVLDRIIGAARVSEFISKLEEVARSALVSQQTHALD